MRILTEADTRELFSVTVSNKAISDSLAQWGCAGEVLANPSAAVMLARHDPASIFIDRMGNTARPPPPPGGAGRRRLVAEGNIAGEREDGELRNNGEGFGMVDVTWLYRRRVGSTGTITAKFLAREDSKRVGLIGAGQLNEEIYSTTLAQ